MSGDQVAVLVKFRALPGQEEALADHLVNCVSLSTDEPGTHIWVPLACGQEHGVTYLFELYADEAAKEAHESTAAHDLAVEQTIPLLAEQPQILRFKPLGGKGIVT